MLARLFLFTLLALGLELGLFVFLLPWSGFWERHYFLYRYPEVARWLLNYYLRGAVSGLGLVDIGLAAWYSAHFHQVLVRWLEPPSPATPESLPRGQTP